MQKSEQINELAKALATAQGQILGAKKDSENPFFKSKYADLASVWDAIRKPLSDNGLSVSQLVDGPNLVTMLLHSSGQFLTSEMPIKFKDESPQSYGSGLSYARRYALAACVGVYQEDDDANAATAQKPQIKPQQRPIADADAEPPPYDEWAPPPGNREPVKPLNHAPKTNGPSEAQIKRLWSMSKSLGWSAADTLTAIKQQHGKDKPELLTREEYTIFTSKLQVEIDKLKGG